MTGWDRSTIAVDPAALSPFQGLDGPDRLRCRLVVYSGADVGRQITLPEGVSSIGRSAAASVQIDDPGLSRLHAELAVDGAIVSLRDLGSANGSFVQDQRLAGTRLLNDGDLLRLGSVVLKFYEHSSLDAALYDQVYRMAMVDEGTGLYNRRFLLDAIRRELRQSRHSGRPLSVIAADLDYFKTVNDGHGHAAGDRVLRDCAAVLGRCVGSSGILGRLGGEEFLVLMPGAPVVAARALAGRMRAAVAEHVFELPPSDGHDAAVHCQTLSLGVAEWSQAMLDDRDLLDAVDRRLYQSKRDGRNRVSG